MHRLLAVTVFGLTVGCGNTISDYCETWASCEGGNDKDRDACYVLLEGDARAADAYDCTDEWDARMECREKYATCEGGELRTNDACDSEKDKLEACIDKSSTKEP